MNIPNALGLAIIGQEAATFFGFIRGAVVKRKTHRFPCFAGFARKWLDSKNVNKVTFSFGEADSGVWSSFGKLEIFKDRRFKWFVRQA